MQRSTRSTEAQADRSTALAATLRLGSLLALVFLGLSPGPARAALVLNELMASNAASLADPQGQFDDWIEIHNPGAVAVDLAGMYLTDDPDDPTKWRFPTDDPTLTTVPAQSYLVVWADKDTSDAGLHANFALSADGESLSLFDVDGRTRLDSVVFPEQRSDLSYGRYPDGQGTWGYAQTPTPGSANADLYEGLVADPVFSFRRGFYDEPFELILTCETPDAVIHYSLDASGPDRATDLWPSAKVYSDPLPIDGTTCLRARAVRPGWRSSSVGTQTYLFPDDIVRQETMSETITQDPVWGPQLRAALLAAPAISLVTTQTVANEDEVETSIEMLFPEGDPGFQADAGIVYAGGRYSVYAKRSFNVRFKGIYGPTRLEFDLFGGDAAKEFDRLVLRSGSHDTAFWTQESTGSRGIYIRNRWASDRQLEMGHVAPHGRFVHLYWNGVYWGQYHVLERPDAAFMASYFGGEKADYDAINAGRTSDGTGEAWKAMSEAVDDYTALQQYLDVTNYADYMLLNFYGGNDWDWRARLNWRAARKRADGAGFKFFAWDNDSVLRTGLDANCVDTGGPSDLWFAIAAHGPFQRLFADRVQKFLFDGGLLTPQRVLDQLDDLADGIEQTIIAECARWGQPLDYTPDTWRTHLDWVRTEIVPERTAVVIEQLRQAGVFPDIDAPTFHVNDVPQHGGPIQRTDPLSMTAPQGTIYYTLDGADPRLPDDTETGFDADLATSLSPTALPYMGPVTLTAGGPVKARAWADGTWSALSEAVFTLEPSADVVAP